MPRRSQLTLSSTTGGDPEEPHGELPESEKASTLPAEPSRKSVRIDDAVEFPSQDKGDMVVVDWDGPDDPENPKKYVVHVHGARDSRLTQGL